LSYVSYIVPFVCDGLRPGFGFDLEEKRKRNWPRSCIFISPLYLSLHLHLHQDRQNPDAVVSESRRGPDIIGTHSGVLNPFDFLRAVYSSAKSTKPGTLMRLKVIGVGASCHMPFSSWRLPAPVTVS
jgi:hypothetical protein